MIDLRSDQGILTLPNPFPKSSRGKAGKRCRKKRAVSKPPIPSRSLPTLQRIARAHQWIGMLNFNPPAISEARSNGFQKFLNKLLRRELKGTGIGFLLVREFARIPEPIVKSHFHAVVTSPVPEAISDKIQKHFVRRCGLKDNTTKVYKYSAHVRTGECKFGKYVEKLEKDGVDVKHAPAAWNYRLLMRPYHFGYLPKLLKIVPWEPGSVPKEVALLF